MKWDVIIGGFRKVVVTSAPITADAATSKVLGVKKTFTVAGTKVTGLSKTEKKVVKVTIKNKKVTVKGLKAGKVTFKIGKKAYTVKVGATKVTATAAATTLKVNDKTTVAIKATNGAKDKLTIKTSQSSVVKIGKSSVTADKNGKASVTLKGLAAGTSTITVKSANTGKYAKVKINVVADEVVTQAPVVSDSPVVSGDPSTSQAPVVSGDPSTSQAPATSNDPNASQAPSVTTGNVTVTGIVTGAAVKVVSGTTVVAETTSATTSAKLSNIAVGTYTLVVSAKGYNDFTQAVTVNGDVNVAAKLVSKAFEVSSITAKDTQGNTLDLAAVTKNGTIVVVFNDEINAETISSETIKITDSANVPIGISSADMKLAANKKVATISLANSAVKRKDTYNLTIEGVKTVDGFAVASKKTTFTVAEKTVIASISSYATYTNATVNTSFSNIFSSRNAATLSQYIVVGFDEAIDATTANTSNLTVTDITKNERKSIESITVENGRLVVIKLSAALTDNKQYTLEIKGIRNSTGIDAETGKLTFAVAASAPTAGMAATPVATLDNIVPTGAVKAWPLLVAGNHDTTTTSKYYAGLQLRVQFVEKLDKASAEANIKLVDDKTEKFVDATVTYDEAAKIATIIPTKDLNEGAAYSVAVLGGLKTIQGIYMDYDKQDEVKQTLQSFTTLEVTSPTVVETKSEDGLVSLDETTDHIFNVTFSKGITTLTSSKVLLVYSNTDVSNYTTVSNILTSNGANLVVTAVPGTDNKSFVIKVKKAALEQDKAYKLIILGEDLCEDTGLSKTAVVFDTSANTLKASTNIVFTTRAEDTTGPVVKNVYTGDAIKAANIVSGTKTNIKNGDTFTFEFNEKLDTSKSLTADTHVVLEKYDGVTGAWNPVAEKLNAIGTTSYVNNADGDAVGLKVTFGAALADGKYRIVIKSGSVQDVATRNAVPHPNPIEKDYKFEFVGDDAQTAVVDYVGTINNKNLTKLTTGNVTTDAKFVVALEETETVNITTSHIKVQDANGNYVTGKVAEATIDTINEYAAHTGYKFYTFTPDAKLSNSTVYTITVDGITDVYGNTIPKHVAQYKTVAADVVVSGISIADGATGVDRQKTITITLSDAVDELNGSKFTSGTKNVVVKLTDVTNSADVTSSIVTPTLSDDKKSVTYKFKGSDATRLNVNNSYKLEVKTQLANGTAQNDIADSGKTVNFTTGVAATDDVKPTLVSIMSHTDQLIANTNKTIGTYTAVNDALVLTFDESVKKDDLKVTITNLTDSTKGVEVLSSALTKTTAENDTLTINTIGFAGANKYKIVISGIKDASGNEVDAATYFLTFTA